MGKEKLPDYSLHRYTDDSGLPIEDRIFDMDKDAGFLREKINKHLNPDLMKIINNQPAEVKDVARDHLKKCKECMERYYPQKNEEHEPEQGDLFADSE